MMSPTGTPVVGSTAIAGRRQDGRGHQHERQHRRSNHGAGREDRPALVLEVRLDGHSEGEDRGRDEVQQRKRAGAGVLGAVAHEEREQAGQEQAQREGIAEAGLPEQERRAQAEPADRPRRSGQVPRPVQRLVPPAEGGDGLGGGRDAEEEHADAPRELEGTAPLAPLVEQGQREDQGEHRGRGGQELVGAHAASAS